MATGKINWFAVGIIALLVYAFVPSVNTAVNNIFSAAPAPEKPKPGEPVLEFCADPSTTMRIGPMQKQYAPGTAVTGEFARVFVNGVDQGLKGDSTTLGVSWNDNIEMYYAENSSTYYAAKTNFKVPCKSTIDTATFDNDAHKLYQIDASTHLNFKVFNEDDGLLNEGTGGATGSNETIGAGDTPTLEASIQGNFEDAFSPYGKMYITLKTNSSEIEEVVLTSMTPGFTIKSGAATPKFRSTAASATEYDLHTFEVNKGLISSEIFKFTIYLDADDTNNPKDDMVVYFDDEDWYRDSKNGVMVFGPETNLNADIGETTDNTKTVYIN